jgi:hypothetical protein
VHFLYTEPTVSPKHHNKSEVSVFRANDKKTVLVSFALRRADPVVSDFLDVLS